MKRRAGGEVLPRSGERGRDGVVRSRREAKRGAKQERTRTAKTPKVDQRELMMRALLQIALTPSDCVREKSPTVRRALDMIAQGTPLTTVFAATRIGERRMALACIEYLQDSMPI